MDPSEHRSSPALAAILAALLPPWGAMPETQQSYIEAIDYTSLVSCYEGKNTSEFGSRFGRSNILVSPNGRFRAYTEAEALVARPWPDGPGCVNTSKLFVSESDDKFEVVFFLERTETETGNGIQVIDWSPDSRLLLVAFLRWIYYSEWCCPKLLLYDAESKTATELDGSQLFSRHLQRECLLEIWPQGFSSTNTIVLKATPWDEEFFGGSSCVQKESLWVVDLPERKLGLLPDDYPVQRYGKFEKHKPQN